VAAAIEKRLPVSGAVSLALAALVVALALVALVVSLALLGFGPGGFGCHAGATSECHKYHRFQVEDFACALDLDLGLAFGWGRRCHVTKGLLQGRQLLAATTDLDAA